MLAYKNRYVKRNVAVELEHVAICIDQAVPLEEKVIFHEFLRSHTNKFSENIYRDKDTVFKSLEDLQKTRTL